MGRQESWRRLLKALALSNDATRHEDGHMIGDPTKSLALQEQTREATES